MRLLVDTNIFVDFLAHREPFASKAELLMVAGKVGEFELWMSSSQVTDLLYILSNGGNKEQMAHVVASVDGLLDFVNVFAPDKKEVRNALHLRWDDPEDALLYAVAQRIETHAIITRDNDGFTESLIPVKSAEELFSELEHDGRIYEIAPF